MGVSIVGALLLLMGGAALAVMVAVRRGRARQVLPAVPPPVATREQASGPAGWFADPSGRHEFRYWDGQRWTMHVSDRGTQRVDPL
jgi:hypothetical protein